MRATVDSEGRIRIPDELREESGLQPGSEVELRWCGDHLEAEPAADGVRIIREGDWLVAMDDRESSARMTVEDVDRLIPQERELRMREVWGNDGGGQTVD